MNLHRDRYLSGAAFFVGVRYRKGGRQVRVFDRTKRWKSAAQALLRRGNPPVAVAVALGRPSPMIARVTSFLLRL